MVIARLKIKCGKEVTTGEKQWDMVQTFILKVALWQELVDVSQIDN